MKAIEKIRHYYNVMGDLSHMNLILKICLTIVGASFIVSMLVIARLAMRPPLIITVLPDGKAILTAYEIDSRLTVVDSEIVRFIREFLSHKYNWTPDSVEKQLKGTSRYIAPPLWPEMQKKIAEDIAYVKNTGMTQQLYIKEIKPDDSKPSQTKKTYVATGDRVIGIKGARFTTDYKIILTIQKRKRTESNLSGLEITFLKEILPKKENNRD